MSDDEVWRPGTSHPDQFWITLQVVHISLTSIMMRFCLSSVSVIFIISISSSSRRWGSSNYHLDPYFNRFHSSHPRTPKALREPSVFKKNYNRSGHQRRQYPRLITHYDFEGYPMDHFKKEKSSVTYQRLSIGQQRHSSSLVGSRQSLSPSQVKRQSPSAGCDTPGGFRPGGSTWQLPGCRRGVCAISLDGSWKTQEDR